MLTPEGTAPPSARRARGRPAPVTGTLPPAGEALPPTFTLRLPTEALERLDTLSRHAVSAILRVAHRIVHGAPGFPPLEALGLARGHARLLRHRLPEEPRDLLVIGRLDVTTDGQRFVTYELNGDQPGGLEYVSLLEDGLYWPDGAALPPRSPYGPYLEAALSYYRRQTGRDQPEGVLLLGNRYHLATRLRRALESFFDAPVRYSELGQRCGFDGTRLLHCAHGRRRQAVDLVLRSPRVNIYELTAVPLMAVRNAWLARRAVIVNPPHARVAGCKALLPLLGEPEIRRRAGLSDEEQQALDELVPEVIAVDEQTAVRLLSERSRWVLKAPLGGKGQQVYVGPALDDRTFNAVVSQALGNPGWTASAYHPPFHLPIVPDEPPRDPVTTPVSIDPYLVVSDQIRIAGRLCRAVLPETADPAELAHVKLNLLGRDTWVDADGVERQRRVGLGRVRPL